MVTPVTFSAGSVSPVYLTKVTHRDEASEELKKAFSNLKSYEDETRAADGKTRDEEVHDQLRYAVKTARNEYHTATQDVDEAKAKGLDKPQQVQQAQQPQQVAQMSALEANQQQNPYATNLLSSPANVRKEQYVQSGAGENLYYSC